MSTCQELFYVEKQPSHLGLFNTLTVALQRSETPIPMNVLFVTLNRTWQWSYTPEAIRNIPLSFFLSFRSFLFVLFLFLLACMCMCVYVWNFLEKENSFLWGEYFIMYYSNHWKKQTRNKMKIKIELPYIRESHVLRLCTWLPQKECVDRKSFWNSEFN